MAKVIVTAQVQDGVKWEKSFRTHVDLFKSYNPRGPVEFAVAGNEVAVCVEPEDVKTMVQSLQEQATIDAMTADGVKRDTVKVHILDKSLNV